MTTPVVRCVAAWIAFTVCAVHADAQEQAGSAYVVPGLRIAYTRVSNGF